MGKINRIIGYPLLFVPVAVRRNMARWAGLSGMSLQHGDVIPAQVAKKMPVFSAR